jgi:hypothetical protein
MKTDEAFTTYAAIQGFDIQGFDRWLPTLVGTGAFDELTQRRQAALEAMLANDEATVLRHLEWMLQRWREIDRSDKLRAKKKERQTEASESGAAKRKETASEAQAIADKWFSLAWAKDPNVGHTKLLENALRCLKDAIEKAGIQSVEYRREGRGLHARNSALKVINLEKAEPMLTRRRAQNFLAGQKAR